MPDFKLFVFSFIVSLSAHGQCPVNQSLVSGSAITSPVSGSFGQSFLPSCTGRIQSISFNALVSTSVLTGTIEIYKGDQVSGPLLYNQSVTLSLALGVNTIDLDEPFEVLVNNQYTFLITLSASVQIVINSGNPYTNGQMYLDGTGTGTDDLVFTVAINEVYPAGINTNLALWLRADANTNTTTNGASVSSWNDISISGNNYVGSGINSTFNESSFGSYPSITFDDNSAVLTTPEITYNDATLYVVVNHSDQVVSNSFFGDLTNGDDLLMFEQATGTNTYGYTATSGSDYQSSISSAHGVPKILSFETTSGSSFMNVQDVINGIRRSDDFNVDVSNRNISNQDIGGSADIAEIILYGGGTNSSTERNKLESYLSLKYGLTYDQNLVASDNSIIWNVASNPSYNNDIAGIGRDDAGSIGFKTGISINTDAMVTMNNPDPFVSDLSFIAWGNNDGDVTTPDASDVDGLIVDVRLSRVWTVSEIGTVGFIDVSIDLSTVPGSKIGSDLRLLIDRDGDGFADNDVLPLSGSLNGEIFKVVGVDFSDGDFFTIGSINSSQTPLPIELLDFSARIDHAGIVVKWKTSSETNNEFFTLEKSADGLSWENFKYVNGSGTTSKEVTYSVNDNQPYYPATYYRLSQTDYDGQSEIFKSIRVEKFPSEIILYPNPFENTLTIQSNETFDLVELQDIEGRVVFSKLNVAFSNLEMDLHHIPSGIYVLKLVSPLQSRSLKVVKN